MATLITVFHVFACLFLILVVLLQAGKGGGVGVALGGQTSAQVFGGRGAGSFLERLTAGTAVAFMITSMSLAYLASQQDSSRLQRRSAEQKAAADKKVADQKAADEKAAKDAEDRAKKDEAAEQKNEAAPAAPAAGEEAPAKPEAAKPEAPKTDDAAKKAAPPAKTE